MALNALHLCLVFSIFAIFSLSPSVSALRAFGTSSVAISTSFTRLRPSRQTSLNMSSAARQLAEDAIKSNTIMVFSKTYCPYCTRAKDAIRNLGQSFKVMELDNEADGSAVQAALLEMTGQRTVPNIFVNGKHVGGCDNTLAAISSGEFQKLIGSK